MEDRELLELAAKAAGYEIEESSVGGEKNLYREGELVPWDPLEDDGDALRLAVALSLWVAIDKTHCECIEIQGSGVWLLERLSEGQDPYVATRRAIVRAAAEIGKGM